MSASPESSGSVSMGAGASEPTPTVPHDQQTKSHPAGSAMPEGGISVTERPEALVAGAFAGGFLFALILKKLGR